MKLAIVIPAFKKAFFERALASLARQTDRSFSVYIGDDCSPEELSPIVDRFTDRLKIHYHRFPNNIGAQNLVEQWRRCLTLLRDEDWIWLFSDDDLASENCVEAFFRLQASTDSDVYRFNTHTIDENDVETVPTIYGPDFESSEEMAVNLLLSRRGNSMPDHVFSREIYARKGFVSTPYAQGADWAISINFSQEKGMRVIQDAKIGWRRAGVSVSSNASKNRARTILGHYDFIAWVLRHFAYLKTAPKMGPVTYDDIRDAAYQNLSNILLWHYRGVPPSLFLKHIKFVQREFKVSAFVAAEQLFKINWQRVKIGRYERRTRHEGGTP